MEYHIQIAREEYQRAQKAALKEQKALSAAGKNPAPEVLDAIIQERTVSSRDLGVMEIPAERIVGTTSAGRVGALTAGFKPLLSTESEFAQKWIHLCASHLGEEGIRDPIVACEYLGNFYVQEGNKRVSVLKHFGSPGIAAQVRRIQPPPSEDPRIVAYYEFLDFYRDTGLYLIQYRHPGDYAALLACLGKASGEAWTDREKRTFSSYFRRFRDALETQSKAFPDLLPEEALLLWLNIYPFRALGTMTASELKRSLAGLKEELKALTQAKPVEVLTESAQPKSSLLNWMLPMKQDYVAVAFVAPLSPESSEWIAGHDRGIRYLEETLGSQVRVRRYFHADSPAQSDALLEQAVAEGARVIFTLTPQQTRSTLRLAVKYPKVKFLNCTVVSPYASVRSFYGRVYEAKFITGAIAGAMAEDDRIGYIGASPILGVPASVNAFALGARMTNPRARICLKWSCLPGSPQEEFLREGIRVVSNRDIPTAEGFFMDGCSYGTYCMTREGQLKPLASPVWVWGRFYEKVIRSVLAGTWDKEKQPGKAMNYLWGMESGMIDVKLSPELPEGVALLAGNLIESVKNGSLSPFRQRIVTQDGIVKNDGSRDFTVDEILEMDWLCDNVEGRIPEFSELLPLSQSLVREQGIHRDRIPKEKEGSL